MNQYDLGSYSIDDVLGLAELIESGTPDDEIYLLGVQGSDPDWGLYEAQAFTRAEAREMFTDWYELHKNLLENDIHQFSSLENYIAHLLGELRTLDWYRV